MAEIVVRAEQIAPGVFAAGSLPDFDVEQAWERTAYQNTDSFENADGKDRLWRITHNYDGDFDSLSDAFVISGSSIDTVRYRVTSERIDELRSTFAGDAAASAALDTLQEKIDAAEGARVEARNIKIGKVIVDNPGRLHMLVAQTGPIEESARIQGLFGTLVGITADECEPVILGQDGVPSRVERTNMRWLYVGTVV